MPERGCRVRQLCTISFRRIHNEGKTKWQLNARLTFHAKNVDFRLASYSWQCSTRYTQHEPDFIKTVLVLRKVLRAEQELTTIQSPRNALALD